MTAMAWFNGAITGAIMGGGTVLVILVLFYMTHCSTIFGAMVCQR